MPYALNWAFVDTQAVDVWTIDLNAPRRALLAPEEEVRAARFRFEADRLHWTNARSALRSTLAGYLSAPPEEIVFRYGTHGKPSTEGIEFNLSHARGRAMIAVSERVPVGIDIEAIRENIEIDKLLRRIGETCVQGTKEQLFQVWTRREARTKALGSPLMEIPPANVIAVDLMAPRGFAASVALVGYIPSIRHRGAAES